MTESKRGLSEAEFRKITKVDEGKREVFNKTPDFDIESYNKLQDEIKGVFESEKGSEDKALDFLVIWESVVSDLKSGNSKNYSPLAMAELFEDSMKFFKADVSRDVKKHLAEAQLDFLANADGINPELVNACKGIWGYYAEGEKFVSSKQVHEPRKIPDEENKLRAELKDYFETRNEFLSAYQNVNEDEKARQKAGETKPNLRRSTYLAMADSGSLRISGEIADWQRESPEKIKATKEHIAQLRQHGIEVSKGKEVESAEVESVRYFTDLYAHDSEEQENLPAMTATKVEFPSSREFKYRTGVEMGPHEKFPCFEHDRLPRPKTIARSQLVISSNPDLHTAPEKGVKHRTREEREQIIVDELPAILLRLYVNNLAPVRQSDSYRMNIIKKDVDIAEKKKIEKERAAMRKAGVKEFISELLKFDSALWQEIGKNYSADNIKQLQNILKKYEEGGVYLAFVTKINQD